MNNVLKILDRHIKSNDNVILALSGGVDSVVLLHLVKNLRPDINVIACHLNHSLRAEADSDERFCKEFCESLNVDFISEKWDVNKYCSDYSKSIEEGARELRHSFLQEQASLNNSEIILLGHHNNDRVETMLFNMFRGASVHGMSAMPERNRRLLRPLIKLTKNEIHNIAKDRDLKWVEDVSNLESAYDRNWLRNEIIPEIKKRRPQFIETTSRTIEHFEQVSDFMKQQAFAYIEKNTMRHEKDISKSTVFNIYDFKEQHPALQSEVLKSLYQLGHGSTYKFSNKIIKEFQRWIDRNSIPNGATLSFGDLRLVNKDGELGFKDLRPHNIEYLFPPQIEEKEHTKSFTK